MSLLKNTSRAFDESSPADSELLNRLQELQDKVNAPSTPSAEETAFSGDDESQVENNNEEPEMGANELAQAASFMEMPISDKAFAKNYNAIRAMELHGEWSINNGGGAIIDKDAQKEEKEKEELEKFRDAWGDMTPEKWDAQMSTEFPGLTNKQALDALKTINQNPKKYVDWAVGKALVKEEDRDEFQEQLKLWEQNEEYKRTHGGKGDPDIEAQIDPKYKDAVVATTEYAATRGPDAVAKVDQSASIASRREAVSAYAREGLKAQEISTPFNEVAQKNPPDITMAKLDVVTPTNKIPIAETGLDF